HVLVDSADRYLQGVGARAGRDGERHQRGKCTRALRPGSAKRVGWAEHGLHPWEAQRHRSVTFDRDVEPNPEYLRKVAPIRPMGIFPRKRGKENNGFRPSPE